MGIRSFLSRLFVSIFIYRALVTLGYWNTFENVKPLSEANCVNLLEGHGAEDMATTRDGLTFITSGLMYPPFSFVPKEGRVYLVDVKKSADTGLPTELIKLTINSSKDLRLNPHGIDLLETEDGRVLLYVVNHSNDLTTESIEKFEFNKEENSLYWIKSFIHDELYSVNDITLLSEDEFFATNDHYFTFKSKLMRALETFSFVRLGSVVYCKEDICSQKTAKKLHFPNGIMTRKNDGQTELLVAQSGVQEIGRYAVSEETKELRRLQSITVPSGLDNFWVSPQNGDIYVTGHPIPWKFLLHAYGLSDRSPSVVLKVQDDLSTVPVYYDEGEIYQSSSIAVHWRGIETDILLLGSPNLNLAECRF